MRADTLIFGPTVRAFWTWRTRLTLAAAHTKDDLDKGLEAFKSVGKKLSVI